MKKISPPNFGGEVGKVGLTRKGRKLWEATIANKRREFPHGAIEKRPSAELSSTEGRAI